MFVENADDIDGDDYFFLEEAIYDRLHEEDRGLFYDCEAADLRAIIRTKDYEIAALKSKLNAALNCKIKDVNNQSRQFSPSVFKSGGKTNSDSKQVLRVQERIEAIQNQEIATLKKVIRIQRAIIRRNGVVISDGKYSLSESSNGNRQHPPLKGGNIAEGKLLKGMKRYEAPTVSSILHTSPKRSVDHQSVHIDLKSGAAVELQREAKKILRELGK